MGREIYHLRHLLQQRILASPPKEAPMRNSPVITVDPAHLQDGELTRLDAVAAEARESGIIALSALPQDLREQLLFALESVARGKQVAAVASGKALTTTEAAELLGMSRTLLTRLCKEGRVPHHNNGSSIRIEAETVMTILRDRGRLRAEARDAVRSAEDRRRERAARAAGLD